MQISFVDPGNDLMFSLIQFHDLIFAMLIGILFFVASIFIIIFYYFTIGNFNTYNRKYLTNMEYFIENLTITHSPYLEFFWTILPSLILINMAFPTFIILYNMDLAIEPAFTIKAIGNQWYWGYESNDFPWNPQKFAFDSFIIDTTDLAEGELRLLEVDNFLVLPTHTEIRLIVTAHDVIHSFALPSLATKMDAIPGRLNQSSLIVNIPGLYFGQCSELCGPNHGFMPICFQFRIIL